MYEEIKLPGGVRLVFESVPYVRTAALGLWVGAGSRDERPGERGAAHFIEHMLFKGTDSLTAAELAESMDAVGGQFNAFTTREDTCFYARVPDYHLSKAAELLGDMFFLSRFDEEDVALERGVICEEIDMYEDTPEDLASEMLISSCFPGRLGRPVLGDKRSLAGFSGESLRAFKHSRYVPSRVVIALSGSFNSEDIDYLSRRFEGMEKAPKPRRSAAAYRPSFTAKRKKTEQNHLCLGFEAPSLASEKRYAAQLLSGILGGGMSSRLFQTVREKHGLCYSIYTYNAAFSDTGLFGVETALNAGAEERALGLIMEELRRFREEGPREEELSRAREQVKAGLVMGLESTNTRMMRLGGGVLSLGRCLPAEAVMARYDAVTADTVHALARELLDPKAMSLSAVGRAVDAEKYRSWIGG